MIAPPALSHILPGELIITPPIISLLFANLVTIVLAIAGHWDVATVMFIYWAQSVIIGIFLSSRFWVLIPQRFPLTLEGHLRKRAGQELSV